MIGRILGSGCALIVLAGSACAADEVAAAGPASYPVFYGYVEVHGGYDTGKSSGTWINDFGTIDERKLWGDESFSGSVIGGAIRAAVVFSPTFSFQADVWDNTYSGRWKHVDTFPSSDSGHYDIDFYGIAGHLTWANTAGVFASAGKESDWGTLGTVGFEAVHNIDNWRFYGQVGFTGGLDGAPSDQGIKIWYAQAVATYYVTPDLSISGNIGFSSSTDDMFGTDRTDINWGARLERKFASMPASAFIAYQGFHSDATDNYPSHWTGTEHTIVAGVRFLFNATTLRDVDQNVGLADLNPVYGEPFPH